MPRALKVGAALVLVAIVVIGVVQAADRKPTTQAATTFSLAAAQRTLAGAPAPLAALHAQASDLLPGGLPAFKARMRALRGHPVVVNKWGSWCGPCRQEFPVFQRMATAYGKRVAFVGIDGVDPTDGASMFLEDFPVPYPSYVDKQEDIARFAQAPQGYPITVFFDRRGRHVISKSGVYGNDAALRADIKRYLGVT